MRRTRVKICGVTSADAVDAVVGHGADAIGLVFAESPRRISAQLAVALTDDLPPCVSTFGVFRRPSHYDFTDVWKVVRFHCLQCDAGSLGPYRGAGWETDFPLLVQVFRLGAVGIADITKATATHDVFVLEGERSGVGERIDWNATARLAADRRFLLAGGLTPDNVAEAIRTVRPYGVDVSSGVESSPGKKDPIKIRDFLQAVRDVDRELSS